MIPMDPAARGNSGRFKPSVPYPVGNNFTVFSDDALLEMLKQYDTAVRLNWLLDSKRQPTRKEKQAMIPTLALICQEVNRRLAERPTDAALTGAYMVRVSECERQGLAR